jgi:hypothetical protein
MLMLGDVVYNLRACLNYLAWDLVRVGSQPTPRHRRDVDFPIYTSSDEFARRIESRLPGVHARHRAIIEAHQPYQATPQAVIVHGPASPPIAGPQCPLAVLQTLSNSDKHHNPQRTFPQSVGQMFFSIDCVDFVSERLEPADPFPAVLSSGAEIATPYGHVTGPNPHAKVTLNGSIAIAIEPGLWLLEALDAISETVGNLIAEIEPIL